MRTFLTLLVRERVGEEPLKPGFDIPKPLSDDVVLLFFKLDLKGPDLPNPFPDTTVDTVDTEEKSETVDPFPFTTDPGGDVVTDVTLPFNDGEDRS